MALSARDDACDALADPCDRAQIWRRRKCGLGAFSVAAASLGGTMANLGNVIRNKLRSWLKIRQPRVLPARGRKPRLGATIIRGDVRITVQAGLSDNLWEWLLDDKWRELRFRPDRRKYREVPPSLVTRLIDAAPEHRARILAAGVARAKVRSGGREIQRPFR